MNLKEFEFSQSYIFFWDKIERANYFLESVIDTAGRPDGDRTVDFLLANGPNGLAGTLRIAGAIRMTLCRPGIL